LKELAKGSIKAATSATFNWESLKVMLWQGTNSFVSYFYFFLKKT